MQFNRPLLQLPIRFEAETLAAEIAALPSSAWVPHPQGFEGNDAVPLVSVNGGLNDDFAGPMAATEHLKRMPYAEAMGFDSVWFTEHHFRPVWSHNSAPDLTLAAISQRTSRIRLGIGVEIDNDPVARLLQFMRSLRV